MRPRTLWRPPRIVLLACYRREAGRPGAPPQSRRRPRAGGAAGRARPAHRRKAGAAGRARSPRSSGRRAIPALIRRGDGLYGVNCRACHGADLRGGDQGGPNLLRSQLVLNDQDGELIGPVVQNGRQNPGMPVMPPLPIPPDDVKAIADVHPQRRGAARAARARRPKADRSSSTSSSAIAKAGRPTSPKCSDLPHAPSDMAGIATRVGDPMALQNHWVGGGGGRGGAAGGRAGAPVAGDRRRDRRVRPEGRRPARPPRRLHVVVGLADGTTRSFRRDGDVPKVEVRDPREATASCCRPTPTRTFTT